MTRVFTPVERVQFAMRAAGCVLLASASLAFAGEADPRDASPASSASPPSQATQTPGSNAPEGYSGPVQVDSPAPVYPYDKGVPKEGWVDLNFMVGADGRTYEPTILGSTGDRLFEQAALKTLSASRYKPASLNGKAIDSAQTVRMKFKPDDSKGSARQSFVKSHRSFLKRIEKGDKKRADDWLTRLESGGLLNLYEDAFLALAKYYYHAKWGNEQEQLDALNRAISHDDISDTQVRPYLPDAQLPGALLNMFHLQVKSLDFGGALQTHQSIVRLATYTTVDPRILTALEKSIVRIETLRDDDRAFALSGRVGPAGNWHMRLLKQAFYLDKVEGEVAELKLRCERKYVFFHYEAGHQLSVPGAYGPCLLEVIGDPGTTFQLVQLKAG